MIVGDNMKKIIISVIFIVYIVLTLVITIFLMNYNRFNIIEIKDVLIVPMNKTKLSYQRGSLLIIKKTDISKIKENDEVFYYTADQHVVLIDKGKIEEIEEVNESEKTVTFTNSKKYSKDYIIGKTASMKKIPLIGYLLMLLTSRIGYLFIILLPILTFFFIQIYLLFKKEKVS